ncbi:hypothetical protein AO072_16295 [Pseudomonas syringae ICMP 13102]|uniref:TcdA/TcdB catalytic glycosyltransferase domain-containing protein n=1 Tax=Pseudomonas syringae TaxID=317 RepID=UPI000730F87F|nr:TcdA/TcdB catalytic glycosyltransferase domain-containing protein [Pseudomonas syringae]KTB81988.1 hypothetical protein AO072_16295 [Pseudomonas syringae ICMP 13102]KWS08994.1 hypothetical protein AL064_16290 [Pseudomonas syringae pv. syringae]MCH5516757.1 AAA family ATPase [Pseudomonas syringae pv. syringae]
MKIQNNLGVYAPAQPSTSGIEKSQTSNALMDVYPKKDFKVVPSNIHMVWVGSQPGDKQQEYVRQWAKKNPDCTVMLWVDASQFKAYETNKITRQQAENVFPEYQSEKLMRGLFSQLETTLDTSGSVSNLSAQKQALSELNKELLAEGNESLKQNVLPHAAEVTLHNARLALAAFKEHTARHDDNFFQAERIILDQTVKSWDRLTTNATRDVVTLNELQKKFQGIKNVQIRDLSNSKDIRLKNKDAYQHEIIGRNGAYPAASDIARYEILHEYGGVYADIDLECMRPLSGVLHAHPDLMLVGLAQAKSEASGSTTPYFANALLAAHPGSKMLSDFIDKIGEDYKRLKGNEFRGDRYFSRPNKSTIEATGPNGLRGHVDAVIRKAQGLSSLMRDDAVSLSERIWGQDLSQNKDFWSSLKTHFNFPENYVNFETDEQQNSATKAMAGGVTKQASAAQKTSLQNTIVISGVHKSVSTERTVTTEKVASLILKKVQEKRQAGKPVIIFVSGPSASGKSTLTKALEQAALTFESIKTDHFLKSFSELSKHPGNRGPVTDWAVVHGHVDSFNRELATRVMDNILSGKGATYSLPSTYREGVMIGGFPRGERDSDGPYKEIRLPVCDTYLIEGICTPHLIKDAAHVVVRLDCEFEETVKRRANRGHDESIPAEVKVAEDKGQYLAFQQAMNQLEIRPDIHLDSSGLNPGQFRLFRNS